MGSGRLDEDQYMHMVVASFLQKNTSYVSVLTDGYAAIHDYFGQHTNEFLKDHDSMRCLMCVNNVNASTTNQSLNNSTISSTPSTSSSVKSPPTVDLFSKIKSKSMEVKGRFLDYIVNPANAQPTSSATATVEKHVLSSEKNGKRYRNVAPVFSINDEDNVETIVGSEPANANVDENERETVNLQTFVKRPDVITALKCQEVHM